MAWIDDRIWCHPKFTDLTAPAFRAYINAIAYSAGMGTRGVLSPDQQRLVGINAEVKRELIAGRLLDSGKLRDIAIHDWDEHNGKRDDRRAADRERKRLARAKERETSAGQGGGQSAGRSAGQSAGQNGLSAGQSSGTSAGPARVDGSEGSEGSDLKTKPPYPNPVVDVALDALGEAMDEQIAADDRERIIKGEDVLHDLGAL